MYIFQRAWTEKKLPRRRKGDKGNVNRARRLRAETTTTQRWIAELLSFVPATEIQPRFRIGDTHRRSHLLELSSSNDEMDLIAHKLSRSALQKGLRETSPAF
jgi:hypothetical protein